MAEATRAFVFFMPLVSCFESPRIHAYIAAHRGLSCWSVTSPYLKRRAKIQCASAAVRAGPFDRDATISLIEKPGQSAMCRNICVNSWGFKAAEIGRAH